MTRRVATTPGQHDPKGKIVFGLAFSSNTILATGDSNGSTYLWNAAAGRLDANPSRDLRDPGGKSVYGIAFSPDGRTVATTDTTGGTFVWDAKWLGT